MKRYLVTAMEYVYYEVEIEANSKEEAYEIAYDADGWEIFDTDQWDIETIEEIKDETV